MQVGYFSMRSAALPKKHGHPAPAQIPYVRVLVQNKKAARAQQGYAYILAETSPFGKLFRWPPFIYRANSRKKKMTHKVFSPSKSARGIQQKCRKIEER